MNNTADTNKPEIERPAFVEPEDPIEKEELERDDDADLDDDDADLEEEDEPTDE